jgi:hypothetical protein
MAWVHAVLDVPQDRHDEVAAFWGRVLGWPAGDSWPEHPELRSFEPPVGTPYLHLQRISGPPRVHLDLEAAEPTATVDRAHGLGAEVVAERDGWVTLCSPGGFPFCVLPAREHQHPEPVLFEDGHRTRMVQVCVDSPQSVHDVEVAFWRALLGRRWVPSGAEEFAGKWHDDAGSPIQLLFQRLDEPDGPVRAHLDLGTDDLPADVRRLRDLGAVDVGPGRGWHVFRDPLGELFCTTLNSPELTDQRALR